VLLRQCILFANELKNPRLRTWAMQELNGYPTPKDVPEYRIVNSGAIENFDGGWLQISGTPHSLNYAYAGTQAPYLASFRAARIEAIIPSTRLRDSSTSAV